MKNTPAFPRTAFNANGAVTTLDSEFHGMSLRDYFAAKAMELLTWNNYELCAKEAYVIADAMLKARGE
jgi:hypothetical protein